MSRLLLLLAVLVLSVAVPAWRAGANSATTFHTDADLDVGGLDVPKGTYTLYVWVQDPASWQLIINKQTGQWGLSYAASQDLGRVKMTIAHHSSVLPDGSGGGNPGGFLLTLADGKIYFACDTALFSDMQLIGAAGLDLAVLPIGDFFTMGPDDALRADPGERFDWRALAQNGVGLWPGDAPGALGKDAKDIPTLTPFWPAPDKASGAVFIVAPGDGAFYGPKIEYTLKDALGRHWQCGTMQVDFNTAERLGGEYVTETSGRAHPVMLHRAILGSLERFLGVYIEHVAGAFPAWLAPVQCVVMGITDRQGPYVESVVEQLRNQGFRATSDLRNEKVGFKIRDHTLQRVPYLLVAGDKEVAANQVSVRTRNGKDLGAMALETFVERLRIELNSRGRTVLED